MKKLIAMLLIAAMAFAVVACTPPAEEKTTYAIVCKDASNPYMKRMVSGFKTACEALGVNFIEKSPETTSAQDQITIINELIAQGVKAIAIAANDAEALEATLKTAREAGIAIVTLDSDTKGSQMFINQAGVKEVAQVLVDSIYDMAGGAGEFAVLSASSTATNQNAWIAAMEEIIAADSKYASLVWKATVYGDDEPTKSTTETQNLMTNYPDLKVICCPTTVGVLACAKAVEGTDIKVAGLGLPSEMKNYVGDDKACPYMYLWNPIDVGNCAAYAIKAILDGKVGAEGTEFTADNGITYKIMKGDTAELQIIVGPPFKFDGANIGEWAEVY
jgi:rhamnose transport system substrate-binding protein